MKKGLKEFRKLYDLVGDYNWLALDFAQNLNFRLEAMKDKTVQPDDVHMAYGLTGMGSKYELPLMEQVHKLAESLGFTKEDYIENSKERRGVGNVQIYIAGQGSIGKK